VTKMLAKRRPRFRPAEVSWRGWRLGRGHVVQSAEEDDVQGQIWETGFIPGCLGGRGGTSGDICGVKVLWSSGNSSPKFRLAAASFGRGRSRRSEEKRRVEPC
jgi:hypothetical protein